MKGVCKLNLPMCVKLARIRQNRQEVCRRDAVVISSVGNNKRQLYDENEGDTTYKLPFLRFAVDSFLCDKALLAFCII